jgi:predicted RNA-binding protein YlxR (DUF448 family)
VDLARAPERTCVGCRQRCPKHDLLRLSLGSDAVVRVDRNGSGGGRGAYVHRERTCVDEAVRRGAVARALRMKLDEGGAATLRADIEGELGS